MGSAPKDANTKKLPATPWGHLPPLMRVLFITGLHRTGGWLAEAFAADSACEVLLDEAVGVAAGLSRLRDEVFDAVLISHEGEGLNALDLLDAIRAGSSEQQPIIVLGTQSEQEMSALCYESGGDAYVCVNTTTTRTLIWELARATERHQLIAENRRLEQAQRHRLQLEHAEATRLLQQQRALIDDLEKLRFDPQPLAEDDDLPVAAGEFRSPCPDLPQPLIAHYRELLRAYVIMGSGNLTEEMNRLADLLASAGVTAQHAMLLHLHVLEEMIGGLGSRSARHVMNRADLLILEVMMNLAEGYRDRFLKRVHPPRQKVLPGFDQAAGTSAAA
jgi:DNA-binding response OmpR family regulator